MSKKILLFLLAISICQQATAQNGRWQKIDLDDSTTIEFPGTPNKKPIDGRQAATLQDDEAIYSVISDKGAYGGNLIDSELQEFYAGVVKGMMKGFGGGEVIDEQPFTVSAFSGRQIRFTTPNKPQFPSIKTVRLLLANGTFYTINFWTNTDQDPHIDSVRNHFFASFKTTMKKTAAVAPETRTLAYKLGTMLGSLFFYGALIAVIVAVVRRFSKPKAA